jgi:hypothetical protein
MMGGRVSGYSSFATTFRKSSRVDSTSNDESPRMLFVSFAPSPPRRHRVTARRSRSIVTSRSTRTKSLYYRGLKEKYESVARCPWLPVGADPPEPE